MVGELRLSHPVAGAPVAGPPVAVEIRVRGCVQGVGFRPTVWRIARELGLDGEVFNDGEGVLIRARGTKVLVAALVDRLEREPPPLAQIERIEIGDFAGGLPEGFHIAASRPGTPRTRISTATGGPATGGPATGCETRRSAAMSRTVSGPGGLTCWRS